MEAYIWDLDGTLLDSYEVITSSLRETLAEKGILLPAEDILRETKQTSVTTFLRRMEPEAGAPFPELLRRYREITGERNDRIPAEQGALEALRRLRNRGDRHFVYTHRGASTQGILDRLGMTAFFEEIVTRQNGFAPKPSGEGALYLVQKYGLDPAHTWYVGDRMVDVGCGIDAGIRTVLYCPADSWVKPSGREDRVIRCLSEL